MNKMQETFDPLCDRLATSGLRILHSGPSTDAWPGQSPTVKSILIIGHAGSEFWPHFKASLEFADGKPDPLDRWSQRVIGEAAPDMDFASPNDGPPFPPIHALTTGGALHPSPLGMLAHSRFGLWVAIRGLLLSNKAFPLSPNEAAPDPDQFADCFAACPVGAFSNQGYAAHRCASYLINHQDAPCWSGCLARRAAKLGTDWAYEPDHARFYMDAFTHAMQGRCL